jgi:hypothetical protein
METETHLIPILAKTSSHWKDFPWPLPPQTPKMRGTCNKVTEIVQFFFFSKNTNRRDYSIIYSIDYKKEVSCYIYLDIRQAHEVLGDVNNKLVHESRSNVETIHVVVQVVPKAQSPSHVHNQTCPQLQTKWKS